METKTSKTPKRVMIEFVAKRQVVVDVSDLDCGTLAALKVAEMRAWANLRRDLSHESFSLFDIEDRSVVSDDTPANETIDGQA